MRILITQRELINQGGSEMVAIEAANALSRRGHAVAIFAPRAGRLAGLVASSGVVVRTALRDLPWPPDVIHGQHHLPTMAALARFPEAAAIYYCHGVSPWVERPPLHPRIRRYLVMCAWMAPRLTSELGIAAARVHTLANFVNTRRFSQVREPKPRPTRALMFAGGAFPAADIERLDAACRAAGLSLDRIGYGFGNPQPRPEAFLPEYDLVFAIGKSAVEAMAAGCAVIPLIPGQGGPLVTTRTFDTASYSNFSPLYFTDATPIDAAWLDRQLQDWAPDDIRRVTENVRRTRSLDAAVDRLEALYAEAMQDPPEPADSATPFAPYLETLCAEADQMWSDLYGLRARALDVDTAQADAARLRAQVANLQAEADALRTNVAVLQADSAAARHRDEAHALRWALIVGVLEQTWRGRRLLERLTRTLDAPPPAAASPSDRS